MQQRLHLRSIEHVGLQGIFIEEPNAFIAFYLNGNPSSVFGIYFAPLEELQDAIMDRATEICDCSMVDPQLSECTACLIAPDGWAEFHYDPEKFKFVLTK